MTNNIQWKRQQPIKPLDKNNVTNKNTIKENNITFDEVLKEQLMNNETVKVSKHATQRINSRNIKLTSEDMDKLNEATNKAKEKGVNDSLVIMSDKAFIVNVKSRTVVTAFDEHNLKENIFTNIDGAVVL